MVNTVTSIESLIVKEYDRKTTGLVKQDTQTRRPWGVGIGGDGGSTRSETETETDTRAPKKGGKERLNDKP